MTTILAGLLGCALIGAQDFAPAAPDWRPLEEVRAASIGGAIFEVAPDGAVRVTGPAPETDTYTIDVVSSAPKITGFRLEVLPDDALKSKGPGRAHNGNFVLTDLRVAAGPRLGSAGRRQPITKATATHSQKSWPVWAAIDEDPKTGWGISPETGQANAAIFELAHPIEYRNGVRLTFTLDFQHGSRHSLGRFRLSWTDAPPPLLISTRRVADPELQSKINAAIDGGIEYLLAQQERDGSWAANQDRYRNGQTALSVYTLVKSGVDPDHPAIQRGLAFLAARDPSKTYSTGCQLMALAAIADPEHKPWARRITDLLVSWQRGSGGWAYPDGNEDLSNIQYAALGLRAARQLDVPIEIEVWEKLAERVMEYQEKTPNPYAPAGYGYHPGREPTGSMTAAGVSVLAICREQLGSAHPLNGRIQASIQSGLEWLTRYFSAKDNPRGPNDEWATYYLYGIERIAALLELERIGSHDWYREGAGHLTGRQTDEGFWEAAYGRRQENTAFSLLFLSRATAPTTGKTITRGTKSYQLEDPASDVWLRASGDTPLTVWISGYGDEAKERFAAPSSAPAREPSLPVRTVEYVASTPISVPGGVGSWRYTDREPKDDWTSVDYSDSRWSEGRGAFGPPSGAGTTVRTEWKGESLWLRKEIQLDPADLVSPELELYWSSRPVAGPRSLAGPPLVELFDEDADFPNVLIHSDRGSRASIRLEGAASGEACLEVTPQQRHNPNIPGWFFPISRKPGEGEYRFLRFAWQKSGNDGVMIQLAFDGSWSGAIRYVAGENTLDWEAIDVAPRPPGDWTVVTRDLIKDLGGREANLTGIALTPMSGEPARFDAIYLGRSLRDLRGADRSERSRGARSDRSAKTVELAAESLSIHLNGEPLYEDALPTIDYERLILPIGWTSRLREGRNVLAVHCQRQDPLQTFDLRLVDQKRLAIIENEGDGGPSDARFAAQLHFERPGEHSLRARVHIATGPESEGEVVLESPVLTVMVEKAHDPRLLDYASDAGRNLLSGIPVRVEASSEMNGWPASKVADDLQHRGWLCVDGDPEPTLTLTLERPVKASRILLSPTLADKADGDRTTTIDRVAIQLNGKGDPYLLDFPRDPLHKAVLELDRAQTIRRIEVRVLGIRPGKSATKTAVGLAEVELQR